MFSSCVSCIILHNRVKLEAKQKINIVWLKRDIRSQDHLPLHLAEQRSLPYLIIFLFEPSIISHPNTSLRHLQFQYHSILQLNKKLQAQGRRAEIFFTEALSALGDIQEQYEIEEIFSYQESGIQRTYDRDKAVAKYCTANNIQWHQCQRDGIVRGIKNRCGWDKQWFAAICAPMVKNEYSPLKSVTIENRFPLPGDLLVQLQRYPASFQPAGEDFAWKYLHSFVSERGKNYSKHISKPLESRVSCGRISPYLSWGNISIKQAYQFVTESTKNKGNKFPYQNFLTRLKWHCHFIQKFEVECSYETQCINAGYELLEHPENQEYISAWKQGETGFPLVDACMKCLMETGWINFRMRAMLVSVFCHHLYQDWRHGTYHLAQMFLDYEPGIHYPQFQMQAGTTGINTIRMYNPVKQSQEHDPEGIFIKKWLPQLQNVPTAFIHEPHKMSLMEQEICGVIIGKDYPAPVVDINEAGKVARKNIWGHRSHEAVRQENKRILFTHTRRKEEDAQP